MPLPVSAGKHPSTSNNNSEHRNVAVLDAATPKLSRFKHLSREDENALQIEQYERMR